MRLAEDLRELNREYAKKQAERDQVAFREVVKELRCAAQVGDREFPCTKKPSPGVVKLLEAEGLKVTPPSGGRGWIIAW